MVVSVMSACGRRHGGGGKDRGLELDCAFPEVVLMQEGAVATLRRPSTRARAGVTNDPRRLSGDMDLRTHAGRRFSDIFDGLAVEFSGADPEKLRELTVLKYELERAQMAGTLTLEDLVRMSHLVERREKALRLALRQRQVERPEGLRSRLAGKYAP
jgi:hypothetical protein